MPQVQVADHQSALQSTQELLWHQDVITFEFQLAPIPRPGGAARITHPPKMGWLQETEGQSGSQLQDIYKWHIVTQLSMFTYVVVSDNQDIPRIYILLGAWFLSRSQIYRNHIHRWSQMLVISQFLPNLVCRSRVDVYWVIPKGELSISTRRVYGISIDPPTWSRNPMLATSQCLVGSTPQIFVPRLYALMGLPVCLFLLLLLSLLLSSLSSLSVYVEIDSIIWHSFPVRNLYNSPHIDVGQKKWLAKPPKTCSCELWVQEMTFTTDDQGISGSENDTTQWSNAQTISLGGSLKLKAGQHVRLGIPALSKAGGVLSLGGQGHFGWYDPEIGEWKETYGNIWMIWQTSLENCDFEIFQSHWRYVRRVPNFLGQRFSYSGDEDPDDSCMGSTRRHQGLQPKWFLLGGNGTWNRNIPMIEYYIYINFKSAKTKTKNTPKPFWVYKPTYDL